MKVLISLFFIINSLFATENKNLQKEADILKEKIELKNFVKSVDGFINEDIHQEFWKDIKDKVSEKDLSFFNSTLFLTDIYMRELWECVLKSSRTGKIIKTEKLKSLLSNFKSHQKMYDTLSANTDSILDSAANKKPISRNGNSVYLTEDAIQNIISGMDASIERLQILFKKDWQPTFRERELGNSAKVLWTLPLTKKISEVTINQKNVKNLNYSVFMGNTTHIAVGVLDANKADTNICIKGIVSNSGYLGQYNIINQLFNGYPSSRTSFSTAINPTETFYFNVQCFHAKNKLYSVITLADNHMDSLNYFDEFIKRIILK